MHHRMFTDDNCKEATIGQASFDLYASFIPVAVNEIHRGYECIPFE